MADISKDICRKSYPDIEWDIPSVKSVLQNEEDTIRRPPYEFCDTNWVLKIIRGNNSISFFLCKELFPSQQLFPNLKDPDSHKIYISFKSFIVKEDGKESISLVDCVLNAEDMPYLISDYNGTAWYETLLHRRMLWMDVQQTDGLKIICKFRCMDCPVKLAYIPILTDDKLHTLKRKHPKVEFVEYAGSKRKAFHKLGCRALLSDIKSMLTTGEDSDVTVKIKDREFKVHKNILRARSPVFFKMFSHDLYEKKNGIIDITDCEPDAFQEFLNYLYTGELDDVSEDIVRNLYYMGDKYEVEEIKTICAISMLRDLSVETFCEIFTFAELYKESIILKKASEFFVKNIKAIIATDSWLPFLKENPVAANELHMKAADHYTSESNV